MIIKLEDLSHEDLVEMGKRSIVQITKLIEEKQKLEKQISKLVDENKRLRDAMRKTIETGDSQHIRELLRP